MNPACATLEDRIARMQASFDALTPEEKERRNQAVEEHARRQKWEHHAASVAALRQNWNAPKRQLASQTLHDGPWGEMFASVVSKLGSGFLIALTGTHGPGKTKMGVELMKASTENLRSAKYMTATEFFIAIKTTYRKDSEESEESVLEAHARPRLLVIDEIGKRSENEWEDRLLFELVDRRYRDMTDTLLIFDNIAQKIKVVANAHVASQSEQAIRRAYRQAIERIERMIARLRRPLRRATPKRRRTPITFASNMSKADFEKMVSQTQEYIKAGDIFQCVLSQRWETSLHAPPFQLYRALRVVNPSPYMFFIDTGDVALAGSSPEMLVKVTDGVVETRPIAGTRQRGAQQGKVVAGFHGNS